MVVFRGTSITNALAARGHNVTAIGADVDPNPSKNVHYIHLEGVYDYMYSSQGGKLVLVDYAYAGAVENIGLSTKFPAIACRGMQRSKGLQTLMNYPKDFKFDLVLYDLSCGPCLIGFLHRFNYPPLVTWTGFNKPPFAINVGGGHNFFSYAPFYSSTFSNEMNFWERVYNMYLYAVQY